VGSEMCIRDSVNTTNKTQNTSTVDQSNIRRALLHGVFVKKKEASSYSVQSATVFVDTSFGIAGWRSSHYFIVTNLVVVLGRIIS